MAPANKLTPHITSPLGHLTPIWKIVLQICEKPLPSLHLATLRIQLARNDEDLFGSHISFAEFCLFFFGKKK